MSQPEPQVTIYVTNGVRTSGGPGPGVKTLPASEAAALVGMKYAVYGDKPPGLPDPEPATRPFPHVPLRRSASSN
jgi:hypothetical protein